MKRQDMALIIVMVFISAVASLLVSRWIFSSPRNSQQKAETVDAITADFSSPPKRYFNAEAVNPTQQIQIGPNDNPSPFNPQAR